MNLAPNIYTDILGVSSGATAAGAPGAIGPGFFTPTQAQFMGTRRRYGGPDDPNVGTFHLSHIVWDKETGDAAFGMLAPMADGWYGGTGDEVGAEAPGPCPCADTGGGCGCS